METSIRKPFSVIKNDSGSIEVWLQRPDKTGKLIITANFDAMSYPDFIKSIEALPYLTLMGCKESEGVSFIQIELTGDDSFTSFIEELPELIYSHVENKESINRIHQGRKEAV